MKQDTERTKREAELFRKTMTAISYKDYKKYLKFIKKEYSRRRKAIDDDNTTILKEHYNTRKWGR